MPEDDVDPGRRRHRPLVLAPHRLRDCFRIAASPAVTIGRSQPWTICERLAPPVSDSCWISFAMFGWLGQVVHDRVEHVKRRMSSRRI